MHAASVESATWWERPRANAASWIETYQNSVGARHRTHIVSVMRELKPATVLEVGAHCGPNLVRLARESLEIEQLSGFDVNAQAVTAGQAWVKRLGLSERIELAAGKVLPTLQGLKDHCVDVVLSCYTLAYTAPADLDAVLYEIGRVATKAIVLAEPQTEAAKAEWNGTPTGYQEWAHNYRAESRWMPTWRGMAIRVEPVSPPVDRLNGILVAVRGES